MQRNDYLAMVMLVALAMATDVGSPAAFGQQKPVRRATGQSAKQPSTAGAWRTVGSMNVTREYAGGILLDNGKVLAVSGHPLKGKSIETAELYDPRTGKWTLTGSLHRARNGGNGATLLANGQVLLAGDHDNSGGHALRGTEIYDPETGKWNKTGSLQTGRGVHTTTLLKDGKVLAAGGIDWSTEQTFATAEVFDPVDGTWHATGSMARKRFAHRAVSLEDGRVFVVGGWEKYPGQLLSTAELYDPTTGQWSSTPPMHEARGSLAVARLSNGRVLVVGGVTRRGNSKRDRYLTSALLYDPVQNEWNATGSLAFPRAGTVATVLGDGRVLVTGGRSEGGRELASAEIYDPATEKWRDAGTMERARRNHRAARLNDGGVLIIGGSTLFGAVYLSSTELFSVTSGN
jgi:N-acetylneuraminic acid mutarotase